TADMLISAVKASSSCVMPRKSAVILTVAMGLLIHALADAAEFHRGDRGREECVEIFDQLAIVLSHLPRPPACLGVREEVAHRAGVPERTPTRPRIFSRHPPPAGGRMK